MGFWATVYSLATLTMFMVCGVARVISPDADRIARAASWVVLFTGLSRLVGYWTDPPWSMVHYPAIDLLMMTLSFGWWQVRGERWAWLLGVCFLSQLGLHAWFWWVGEEANLYRYLVINNALFSVSLLVLTVAGGGHVAVWLRDRVRLLRGRSGRRMAHGSPS